MDDKADANRVPIGGIPFDERAALEELEHFRREIERYQALRHGVNHEFEDFVQSFKSPGSSRVVPPTYAAPTGPVAAPKPTPPPEAFIAPTPITVPPKSTPLRAADSPPRRMPEPPVAAKAPEPPPAPFQPSQRIESARAERMEAVAAPAVQTTAAPPKKLSARRSIPKSWMAVGSAIVILAVGGYAWMRSGDTGSAARATNPTPQQTPHVPAAPSATQAPPVAAPPVKPAPFESELVTTAPVWVRLIADGERLFERELPAGHRVPFTAHESIVIRAGNPAAVRLTMGGVDVGVLGPEGFPMTRRFNVPK